MSDNGRPYEINGELRGGEYVFAVYWRDGDGRPVHPGPARRTWQDAEAAAEALWQAERPMSETRRAA